MWIFVGLLVVAAILYGDHTFALTINGPWAGWQILSLLYLLPINGMALLIMKGIATSFLGEASPVPEFTLSRQGQITTLGFGGTRGAAGCFSWLVFALLAFALLSLFGPDPAPVLAWFAVGTAGMGTLIFYLVGRRWESPGHQIILDTTSLTLTFSPMEHTQPREEIIFREQISLPFERIKGIGIQQPIKPPALEGGANPPVEWPFYYACVAYTEGGQEQLARVLEFSTKKRARSFLKWLRLRLNKPELQFPDLQLVPLQAGESRSQEAEEDWSRV